MNNSKSIALTIAGLISIAIVLLIIQLLSRKAKSISESEGKFKISYGVWFVTIFIAALLVLGQAMTNFGEAIDNIYKMNPASPLFEITKAGSIFIGLSLSWFLIWYFISNFFSILIVGKRRQVNEMEADNYIYFLIRGIIVIGFIICLAPTFESLLRVFMPNVELPFYH